MGSFITVGLHISNSRTKPAGLDFSFIESTYVVCTRSSVYHNKVVMSELPGWINFVLRTRATIKAQIRKKNSQLPCSCIKILLTYFN